MNSLTLLHIPHSVFWIPREHLGNFVLSETELRKVSYEMVDWYTDELYPVKKYEAIIANVNRLVVDVERFADDELESMSKIGQGVVYTHVPDGRKLSSMDNDCREKLLQTYYYTHHEALSAAVKQKMARHGKCLIVDCHSFAESDLNIKQCKKPDICIGTDPFHTPQKLIDFAVAYVKEAGFSVEVNVPFSGTMVPKENYKKNTRVSSIMIELNRDLYLEQKPCTFVCEDYVDYWGKKNKDFRQIAGFVEKFINDLDEFVNSV